MIALLRYAGADLYAQEVYGCSIGWNNLAGIGHVETDHGRIYGGAVEADGGVIDINNLDDAALSAARYLCQASNALDSADAWDAAIRSYNNNTAYRNRVAESAAYYGEVAARVEGASSG